MTGAAETRGPTYISSHSADVILSDIRPIKLQIDALRSINVLLDEFLYNVLSAARSLSTDKLRAGLLKVLPTSLGKEALLEAEVELRAYWDRTNPSISDAVQNRDDQGKGFHLQWAFELLRLKCEAYSTLNESDDDPEAESRLQHRMSQAGGLSAPKQTLVAPASLYLTAILEALCEHILSNVGRVTARDSSKTSATAQDLFVALCEDNSIYGPFRSMKVYEQIESLSKASKPRQSKSISSSDKLPSSSNQSSKGSVSPPLNSRNSSESSASTTALGQGVNLGSRTSSDKTRSMKMFGKTSTDREVGHGDSQHGHQKSDSVRSAEMRPSMVAHSSIVKPFEDEALLQEFDNLMLSDATMKVSLTPDRLKSMDLYNKEKNQRSSRLPSKSDLRVDTDSPVPRSIGRKTSLRHVDSIKEDEEEGSSVKTSANKNHQGMSTSSPGKTLPQISTRDRSFSASHTPSATRTIMKKSSRTEIDLSTPPTPKSRERQVTQPLDTFPTRTGKVMPAIESNDLDDATGYSDDDTQAEYLTPSTPSKRRTPIAVSATTRDLIDFLSEGPPENVTPNPKVNNASAVSLESGKSKGSGRLQRMISRLSMSNSNEKAQQTRASNSDISRKISYPISSNPSTPVQPKTFNMILANKPIPPRPPTYPLTSSSQDSLVNHALPHLHSRNAPVTRRAPPVLEPKLTGEPPVPNLTPRAKEGKENGSTPHELSLSNGQVKYGLKKEHTKNSKPNTPPATVAHPASGKGNGDVLVKSSNEHRLSKRLAPQPSIETNNSSHLFMQEAREIRRLFSNATTADECRLLYDMFLTKSGVALEPTNDEVPYPSPVPSVLPSQSSTTDTDLEHLLAELLLGDGASNASSLGIDATKTSPTIVSIPSTEESLKSKVETPSQIENDTPRRSD